MSTEVEVLPRAAAVPSWAALVARLPAKLRGPLVGRRHGTTVRVADHEPVVGPGTMTDLFLGEEMVSAVWLRDTPETLELNIESLADEYPLPPGVVDGWRLLGHRLTVAARPNGVWAPVVRALAGLVDGVILVEPDWLPVKPGLYTADSLPHL